MSDRIRDLMKQRQDSMYALAEARRPIDLDDARANLQGQYEMAKQQNDLSPIRVDDDMLRSLYEQILGPSMASQILEQYMSGARSNLQKEIASGEASGMRPMVNSVMQLDR